MKRIPNRPVARLGMLLLLALITTAPLFSQEAISIALDHLQKHHDRWGLDATDILEVQVKSSTFSAHNGVTHVYLRQLYQGLEIPSAEANMSVNSQGKVVNAHVDFQQNLTDETASIHPSISAKVAITAASAHFGIPFSGSLRELTPLTGPAQKGVFQHPELSQEPITVQLMFFPTEEAGLRLVWDFALLTPKGDHWWSLKVDALNGDLLDSHDWVSDCKFDHTGNHILHAPPVAAPSYYAPPQVQAPNTYNVYDMPLESPNHGARTLVSLPWDLTASPFGWHDTDGTAGAEFTNTQGNNVLAQEDQNGNNGNGARPNGGPTLDFDFPVNLTQQPNTYTDAATTNLFYWNNLIHDVWYHYGFDEASGNFQENNYGRGGDGTDYVLADAQDGSGTNNANFGTPPDGQRPRMQMFLWNGRSNVIFDVNSPAGIAGAYTAVEGGFGPGLTTTPLTADLILADDGSGSPTEACNALTNGAQINGNIALVDRGNCVFVNKVQNAENAGAIACVVCNNVAGAPFAMGGAGGGITIPSVMISQADCAILKAQLASGVNISLSNTGGVVDIDGDFDNGIIAHEYGHGVSNRLTGGRTNTSCLGNQEQMGEGWSDYIGLMMTIEPGDQATDARGIGTFATSEPITGDGIRPFPYSTDMGVNPTTYADIQNTGAISRPHGVGFLWCTMIWDVTWALIDRYGYDSDLINGTGGNNIAMQLVMDGMKFQPCSPGFVDGRDAILLADTLNNGAANACLIWTAFARRGLGESADQGSTNSRTDGSEAFDVPPCVLPVENLALSATPQANSIQLDWSVTHEAQNIGFEIQRRTADGTQFTPIGFVDGQGTQAEKNQYGFNDATVVSGITYYYRLRQLDADGSVQFSQIVSARIEPEFAIQVFPNPSQGEVWIKLGSGFDLSPEIRVFDLLGREIELEIQRENAAQFRLDFKAQSAGTYVLKMRVGSQLVIRKVQIE